MKYINIRNEKEEIVGNYEVCESLWSFVKSFLELAQLNSQEERNKDVN